MLRSHIVGKKCYFYKQAGSLVYHKLYQFERNSLFHQIWNLFKSGWLFSQWNLVSFHDPRSQGWKSCFWREGGCSRWTILIIRNVLLIRGGCSGWILRYSIWANCRSFLLGKINRNGVEHVKLNQWTDYGAVWWRVWCSTRPSADDGNLKYSAKNLASDVTSSVLVLIYIT